MVVNQLNIKKNHMKIKFKSDDDLPLSKILSISGVITVARYVLQEDKCV